MAGTAGLIGLGYAWRRRARRGDRLSRPRPHRPGMRPASRPDGMPGDDFRRARDTRASCRFAAPTMTMLSGPP
jgi:hypothetical protein